MEKQVFGSLLVFLVASACGASAQQHAGVPPADTGTVNRIVLLDPGLSLGRATFLLPSSVGTEVPFRDPSMMFAGGGFPGVGSFIGGVLEPRADLMSPLRLQWAKERNLNYFQMVLGAVETGAVGYMAYRHVKKYGLFR
jgi:hypothetical protein